MSNYTYVDGEAIKKALKEKGIKQVDVSEELGKSHAWLSNCLSQGYLDDKDLRYICVKYGIPYYDVKRAWAKGNVTTYKSVRTADKLRAERKAREVDAQNNGMSTDEKMDLILRNMLELNKMMAELIRRGNDDYK